MSPTKTVSLSPLAASRCQQASPEVWQVFANVVLSNYQVQVTQLNFKEKEGIFATVPFHPKVFLYSTLRLLTMHLNLMNLHSFRVSHLILNQSSSLDYWPGKRPGSLSKLFQAARMLLPGKRGHLGFTKLEKKVLILFECWNLDPIGPWLFVPEIETAIEHF